MGRPERARKRPPARRAGTATPSHRPTRDFSQQRAADTFEALLRAARDVFAEKGFDLAQTPEIARRAGVAVGTFYRYFVDKRQVFVEMIGRHLESAHKEIFSKLTPERFADSVSGSERRAAIDTVLDIMFTHLAQHPDLERVYLDMSLRDPEVAQLRMAFEERGRLALAGLIEALVPRSRVPDATAAAHVLQVAVLEVALVTLGVRGPHHTPADPEAVKRALGDLIDRYLFG